ncbi:hypothetical protein PIB30_076033, partial [Stylosanthes scabra]|nr:hypothetical protein [Stylosanthes scabra]
CKYKTRENSIKDPRFWVDEMRAIACKVQFLDILENWRKNRGTHMFSQVLESLCYIERKLDNIGRKIQDSPTRIKTNGFAKFQTPPDSFAKDTTIS